MPQTLAASLAADWLAITGSDATYFTNGTWGQPAAQSTGWQPISNATFDAGIIAVAPQVSAILWVEDED